MTEIIIKKLKEMIHSKYVPWIVYLLLLIGAAVNVSYRGGAFSYVFFYVVIFYPVISLLYILYSMFALTIYQETEKKVVHKNTDQDYRLIMENVWYLPISGIGFYYDENITDFKVDFTKDTYRLMAREKLEISTRMSCRFAGGYDAGIVSYYLRDIFGLVRIKRTVKIPVRIHVLPVITDIAHESIKELTDVRESGNMITLVQPENHLGNDIRKYVEGDSLSTIHWKNYARTGEMYVRLPDNQESEMLCVVLVTEMMDGTLDKLKARDIFLEYLVSIGEYFGTRKKPVMICYYNFGVQTFVIDSLESFQEFYIKMLSGVGLKAAAGNEKVLLDKVAGKYGNVVVFREMGCCLERA